MRRSAEERIRHHVDSKAIPRRTSEASLGEVALSRGRSIDGRRSAIVRQLLNPVKAAVHQLVVLLGRAFERSAHGFAVH
jgi:hypothetical protein